MYFHVDNCLSVANSIHQKWTCRRKFNSDKIQTSIAAVVLLRRNKYEGKNDINFLSFLRSFFAKLQWCIKTLKRVRASTNSLRMKSPQNCEVVLAETVSVFFPERQRPVHRAPIEITTFNFLLVVLERTAQITASNLEVLGRTAHAHK